MKLSVEIVGCKEHNRGRIYTFAYSGSRTDILFLNHSIERARKWQLSIEQIGECLLFPDEVLKGHFGRYIAHKLTGTHLIRAVYEYSEVLPTLVTVYYPHAQRYFQGGIVYENKILK
ncbi:MAG: DUF4258 domain-containing protein [Thermodesulfobacteriota bacterium]